MIVPLYASSSSIYTVQLQKYSTIPVVDKLVNTFQFLIADNSIELHA